jgi:hypothetical protein
MRLPPGDRYFMAFGMPEAKFVKRIEDVETLKNRAA